ncbi:Ig-like domain-containing protein, partial [Microcoleus sp. AT9_B4]
TGATAWNFTTAAAPDTTAPTATFTPAYNATNIAVAANLVVTLSEAVQKGTGNIVIKKVSDNSVVETVNVTAANVTVSGSTVTVNPTADLVAGTDYYVEIAAGAIKDLAGNNYAGTTGATAWNFTTAAAPDTTAPTATFTPAYNATNIAVAANLVVTLSEAVQKGTGNIVIKKTDGTVVETINVTSTNVTVTGSTVTVNPTADLAQGTGYYVEIANGAIKDLAGNNYAGTTGATAWNFTTAAVVDTTPPTASTFTPAYNATNIAVAANLVVILSEAVQKGTGNIVIKKTDGTVMETINVTSTNVTVTGSTVTVNPTADLAQGTGYYVEIANGAIKDLAGNNYAGTTGATAWNFTTAVAADTSAPTVTLASTAAATVNNPFNVTATFNESVTGFIATDVSATNGTVSGFSGTGSNYNFTVTPTGSGTVTVNVPASIATDAAGNNNTAAAPLTRTFDSRIYNWSQLDAYLKNNKISVSSVATPVLQRLIEKVNPLTVEYKNSELTVAYDGNVPFGSFAPLPLLAKIASDVTIPISKPSVTISKLNTSLPDYELSGKVNFEQAKNDGKTNFLDFINEQLKIKEVELITEVKSGGTEVGLTAKLGTEKLSLLKLGQVDPFWIEFTGANLKAGVTATSLPAFGIGGNIVVTGYDPFQNNEPELTLSGGLNFDPKSITGKFQLASQTPWKNPFGLPDSEIRNLALQIGGTYAPPWVDNVGFVGDLRFGNFDLKSAFFVSSNDPKKFAAELTANNPINIVDLWTGPVASYLIKQVGKEVDFVKKAETFLKEILNVNIVSIDGPDADQEVDPLLKLVPVNTKIANTELTQGLGINGKVTAWGKEATLSLNANPYDQINPSLSGFLRIPEINLGFLKLTGADSPADKTLDLAVKLSSTEKYLKGDARLDILGTTIAKANVEFTPTSAKVKDFDLDFGFLALDIDNLSVDVANKSASGAAKLKFLDNEIAAVQIALDTTNGLKAKGNLNLFGVLEIENATIDIKSPTEVKIGGKAKIFGRNFSDANISINDRELNVKVKLEYDLPFIGNVGASLDITSDGSAGGSRVKVGFNGGPLGRFGYELDLAPLRSLDDVFDKAAEYALGLAGEFVNQAIDAVVQGFNSVQSAVLDTINDVGKSVEKLVSNTISSISGAINYEIDVRKLGGDDRLYGDGGDNVINARDGNDTVFGLGGNDRLVGEKGNDNLNGGSGNDELRGQSDNDTLVGEGGNDLLDADSGNDSVDGGGDSDRILGGMGNDTLYGQGGDDYLTGWTENDFIYGGPGNDLIYGSAKDEVAVSGSRDSFYYKEEDRSGQNGDDRLYGDEGNDAIYAGIGTDFLSGGSGSDLLYGGNGNDNLNGDDGSDLLDGGPDTDTINGGPGDDRLLGDTGNDYLNGGDGKDEIHGYRDRDTLLGGADKDILYGQGGGDSLRGGDGDDVLFGEDNGKQGQTYDGSDDNDYLDGDAGQDYLFGGVGADSLQGGDGNDFLYGERDNDKLNAGLGNDYLDGGDGDDGLNGEQGNDKLYGQKGNDFLEGFGGNDYLYGGDGDDKLYSHEGDDLLKGEAGNDHLAGWIGKDTLVGGEGNDSLYGEPDDDLLQAGNGNDVIDGGEGNDTLILEGKQTDYQLTETSTGTQIVDRRNNNVKTVTKVENFEYKLESKKAVDFNLSSVFDRDVIVNKTGAGTDITQQGLSPANENLVTQSFGKSILFGVMGDNLPDSGLFKANAYHPNVQLGYNNTNDGNNAKVLTGNNTLFKFDVTPSMYSQIHLFATATNGLAGMQVKFDYSDGSNHTENTSVPDWYDEIGESFSSYYLIDKLDRTRDGSGNNYDNADAPAIFGFGFNLNPAKTLQKITVTKTSGSPDNWLGIFGATGVTSTSTLTKGKEIKYYNSRIIDGYITNGKVFFDANLNGILDEDEPFTITLADGSFDLNADVEKFDINKNGELDYTEGQFVLMGGMDIIGGVDVATGLPMATPLTSTLQSTVVTPLTTAIADLVKQGADPATAETKVKAALGLPAGVDVGSYDPLEAIAKGDANGVSVFASMIMVQNTIVQTAKFIEGVSETEVAQLAFSGIGAIANQLKGGAAVDLGKTETILAILQAAITKAAESDPKINPTQLAAAAAAAAQIMALGNQMVKDLVASGRPIKDIALDITKLQAVSVGQIAVGLPELAAGTIKIEDFLAQNTKEAILARVAKVKVNDPTVRPTAETLNLNNLVEPVESSSGEIGTETGTETPSAIAPTPPIAPTPSVTASETPTPSEIASETPTTSETPTPTPTTNNLSDDECICDKITYPNLNRPNSVENTILDASSIQIGTAQNDELLGSDAANIFEGKSGDDNLYGGADNDIINGNQGNDFIAGGKDEDTLYGDEGSDIILGESGNDLIFGGKGNDFLHGREGIDIIYGNKDDDFIDGGKDNDTLYGGKGNDILLGSQGDDNLFGQDGTDTICGGEGNDLINGDAGADILGGCAGNDTLYGGADNDTLTGGKGNDILDGGMGNDSLIGGSGNDIFALKAGEGFDIIADFNLGQDLIGLSGGLSFGQLEITQNTQGTIIKNLLTGEQLGVLSGVSANAITSANFMLV